MERLWIDGKKYDLEKTNLSDIKVSPLAEAVTRHSMKISIFNSLIEGERFRFSADTPQIGDRVLFMTREDGWVYFGKRMSQNYYQSGNLIIPVENVVKVITIKEE